MYNQIRQYADGTSIWVDPDTNWIAFCPPGGYPQDADSVVRGYVDQSWIDDSDAAGTAAKASYDWF